MFHMLHSNRWMHKSFLRQYLVYSTPPSQQSFQATKGTPENIAGVLFPTSLYSLRATHGASSTNGPLVITCSGNRGMFQVWGFSLHCTVSLSSNSLSASITFFFAFFSELSKGFILGLIKLLVSPSCSLSILPFSRKEMVYR